MALTVSSPYRQIGLNPSALQQARPSVSTPLNGTHSDSVRFSAKTPNSPNWHKSLQEGRQLLGAGKADVAFLAFNTAYQQLPQNDFLNRCDVLNYMGLACTKMKKFDTAELCLLNALQIAQKKTKSDAPRQEWITFTHLGDLYRAMDNIPKARQNYNQVIAQAPNETSIQTANLPAEDKTMMPVIVINAHLGLGFAALKESQPQEALQQMEKGLTFAMKYNLNAIRPGQKQETIEAIQEAIVTICRENQMYDKALSYLEDCLEARQTRYGETHASLEKPLEVKADILENMHEYEAARQVREQIESLDKE